MDNSLCGCDCATETEKIKVRGLDIIVSGTAKKPYYEIKYVTLDGVTRIGYSSYDLENVFDWKENCFEIVATEEKNNGKVADKI